MASSLQRSQSELANLLEEQAALRRVATLVAEGTPPEKVFPTVNEEVARLLDVDGTRLVRYEADGTATIVASWGEPTIVPAGTRIALDGRNIASLVRSSGRPARIEDYENAPGSVAAIARERGVRSAVGAPITVEGVIAGLTLRPPTSCVDAGECGLVAVRTVLLMRYPQRCSAWTHGGLLVLDATTLPRFVPAVYPTPSAGVRNR